MQIVVEKPKIGTVVDSTHTDSINSCYKNTIQQILKKALPKRLFFSDMESSEALQKQLSYINDFFPIISWTFPEKPSDNISVILICKQRLNATSFFYDMISRFLIPHKRLNIDLFFSADFRLPELSSMPFTAAEISIGVDCAEDLEEIKQNFRTIETEIRLGVASNYHANRILEFKGLSLDGKTAMIQEKISSLIQNRSKEFDRTIFTQMQNFLINCQEEFKSIRDYHHISRIISLLHTIRKLLHQKICSFPNQRHLIIKFLKTKIKIANTERAVLGVMVGLNFLRKREVFEKTHLIRAIKDYIQDIKPVDDSFFLDRNRENTIQSIYLEIEKKDGSDFSLNEVKLLRKVLPEHLKEHIEHLMHPVFMPRNEEEILRNIMTLSKQLKYVNDVPQVIVNFEEQKEEELVFTVILLRVLSKSSKPCQEILLKNRFNAKCIIERTRKVGVLRSRYYKEANVFKLIVNKASFYRSNLSVDLHKARQHIIAQLNQLFGEIRDYNGGMIHKQSELFEALKQSLGKLNVQNTLMLEKFFFSIMPVEMRSILKPDPLKFLFLFIINNLKKIKANRKECFLLKKQEQAVYVLIFGQNSKKVKSIQSSIERLKLPSYKLVISKFNISEVVCQGYIYFSEDTGDQLRFLKTIEDSLDF